MRILHVIQEMRMGGAERVVASLVRGAEARGHQVAVAAAPGAVSEELGIAPFPLPLIRRKPWRVPLGAWRVLRAARAFRPDIVHAQNPAMGMLTAIATARGRRPRALVSIHGVPEADYGATARLLRLAGLHVVACGPGVESGLAAAGFDSVQTIPNAVPPPPAPRDRAELEREAGEAGVGDRVVFAGLRPDARAIMGAADAVVVTSHGEGLPLVALEALAARTPLVATSVRGIRELLTDGQDSVLVPPGNARALAAGLSRVLDDEELAVGLAETGAALVAPYTETRMIADYLTLYEELLAG